MVYNVVPYCYFMFLDAKIKWKKIVYGMAMLIITLSIIATLSRAGLVGLLAAGLVMWWYTPNKLIATVAGVIGVCLAVYVGGKAYIDEMSTITDTEHSTASYRLEMWKEAWNLWLEKPLGRGLRSSAVVIRQRGDDPMENHSIWLTSLVETGIIGFWFFMALWYVNIRDTLMMAKHKLQTEDGNFLKWFSLGSLGAIAAYAGAGSFTHTFYYPHFWYISVLIAIATKFWFKEQNGENSTLHKQS